MALGWRKEYYRYQTFFLNIVNLYKQKQDLRMFLEVLLSLLTISFFSLLALKPTLLTILQLTRDIKGKEEAITQMDTKITNLETAQSIADQGTNQMVVINSSVFDVPSPPIFAGQIEGLANKNSVNILGMTTDKVLILGKSAKAETSKEKKTLPANAKSLNFSFSGQGDYANLVSFLRDLENLRLILKIDTVTYSISKTQDKITLAVSGRIPYLGTN